VIPQNITPETWRRWLLGYIIACGFVGAVFGSGDVFRNDALPPWNVVLIVCWIIAYIGVFYLFLRYFRQFTLHLPSRKSVGLLVLGVLGASVLWVAGQMVFYPVFSLALQHENVWFSLWFWATSTFCFGIVFGFISGSLLVRAIFQEPQQESNDDTR
jgi:hypothetical protein